MNNDGFWAKLFSACGVIALRRNRRQGEEALKAELHDWESEGGSLAPSPKATDALVTTGSA